jgi:hypothetical protein
VAELPERQRLIAKMMAIAVRGAEDNQTMTRDERNRLRMLENEAAWRKLNRRDD